MSPSDLRQGAGETGILTVTYLVFLSTAVNFALHSVFTVMMNLFILAVGSTTRINAKTIRSNNNRVRTVAPS